VAEFPSPSYQATGTPGPGTPSQSLITVTLVAYALFGIAVVLAFVSQGVIVTAPLVAIAGIVALVLLYVKRDDVRGTWLASHYRWLIRTFWYSLLWAVVGWVVLIVFALVLIGFALGPLVWLVASIWTAYRIVKGYLLFQDSRPIPGM
jgi:uncharacterized membrane protein